MAEDRGRIQRSYLGEAATRLARALGLDGLITPKFPSEQDVIPVALVADCERPGMGQVRGRRFGIQLVMAAGTVGSILNRSGADVQIDCLIVSADLAGRISLQHLSEADTAAVAGAVADGRFLDRNLTEEISPLLRAAAGAGGASFGSLWNPANGNQVIPFPFLLVTGTGLAFTQSNAAATTDVTVLGRVF